MRIVAGVVAIFIAGAFALVGLFITGDSASSLAGGPMDTTITDVWDNEDEFCPSLVRVTWGDNVGTYDCADAGLEVGDTLTLYSSPLTGVLDTGGSLAAFLVFGLLAVLGAIFIAGVVLYLMLAKPRPKPQPGPPPASWLSPPPSAT